MKTVCFAHPSAQVGRSLAVSLTEGEFAQGPYLPGLSAIHFPRSPVSKRAAGPTGLHASTNLTPTIAL